MNDAAAVVLKHLVLEEKGADRFRSVHPNEGARQVFGGQLMAQSLCAASKTVTTDHHLASFHASFTSPADRALEIDYQVARTREGRTFAARNVIASQSSIACFQATVSFQAPGEGLEHCAPMPDVPLPRSCADLAEVVRAYRMVYPDHLPEGAETSLPQQPVNMCFVNVEELLTPSDEPVEQRIWIRLDAAVGANPVSHKLLLAYMSDQTLAHVVAQPHGIGGLNPRLRFLSLDHSMWYHRPCRVDEWLLLVRRCESAASGRAIVRGEVFDSGGVLVALLAQEAFVRMT